MANANSSTKEYVCWTNMLHRCKSSNYKYYAARGIRVCNRWMRFENFLTDMGRAPSKKHSIDRIDVNGDYEPGNCRWATNAEQGRNKRSNRLVSFDGKTMIVADWAKHLGISRDTLVWRLNSGWSLDRALSSD